MNTKLQNQILYSIDTKLFLETLEKSLKEIKGNISKQISEPLKVEGDIIDFQLKLKQIEQKLSKLNDIKNNYQTESQKLVKIGEIKNAYEQLSHQEIIKPIDNIKLNQLIEDKFNLKKIVKDN